MSLISPSLMSLQGRLQAAARRAPRSLPLTWLRRRCRSWNHYGCGISEQLIRNQTDAFKKYLAPAGYEYLNLDECASLALRSSRFLRGF